MTPTASPRRLFKIPDSTRHLVSRLRYLHPPVVILVRAAPGACVATLMKAAKPSLDRLHLRDLYLEGRRYYIEPQRDGFRLTSNSKLLWGTNRARTPFAATCFGTLSPLGDGVTCVRLRVQTNWLFTLRGFLVPAWISIIALTMPWDSALVLLPILMLFLLAGLANRLNAALQASEMIYFVQKALDDLPSADLPELSPASPDVVPHVQNRDFREQWTKFYEQHRDE